LLAIYVNIAIAATGAAVFMGGITLSHGQALASDPAGDFYAD